MIDVCSGIKPHNRQKGSMLLSEGLLDLYFSVRKGDTTSLRLANYIRDRQEQIITEEQRDQK